MKRTWSGPSASEYVETGTNTPPAYLPGTSYAAGGTSLRATKSKMTDWLRSEPKLTPPDWWADLDRSDLPADEVEVNRFLGAHEHRSQGGHPGLTKLDEQRPPGR